MPFFDIQKIIAKAHGALTSISTSRHLCTKWKCINIFKKACFASSNTFSGCTVISTLQSIYEVYFLICMPWTNFAPLGLNQLNRDVCLLMWSWIKFTSTFVKNVYTYINQGYSSRVSFFVCVYIKFCYWSNVDFVEWDWCWPLSILWNTLKSIRSTSRLNSSWINSLLDFSLLIDF